MFIRNFIQIRLWGKKILTRLNSFVHLLYKTLVSRVSLLKFVPDPIAYDCYAITIVHINLMPFSIEIAQEIVMNRIIRPFLI